MNNKVKILFSIEEAFSAIIANKLRSLLTATGIVFGVASVISMIAISRGSQKEILDQISKIGAKNIIIEQSDSEQEINSTGALKLNDINSLENLVSSIQYISPYTGKPAQIQLQNKYREITLAGVNNDFFKIFNIEIIEGSGFNSIQTENNMPVCIINEELKRKLNFNNDTGQYIKIDKVWLKITGTYKSREQTKNPDIELNFLNNFNTIYTTHNNLKYRFGRHKDKYKPKQNKQAMLNKNNIDRIVLQVNSIDNLISSGKLIKKVLERRHPENKNLHVIIPLEILNQHKKSKKILGIVLGLIAGISLVVGGIGIMNIMLASVYERIKEIGLRKAVGATNNMIVAQFVTEAVIISVMGGFIGVILGILASKIISIVTGIATIISLNSILLAFIISILTGIFFGWAPAKKAAAQNPVNSLNYG